jgi:phosphoserine phosphatase RsbU/P
MTAVPAPRQPSPSSDPGGNYPADVTPVFALKELVSRLHREQSKIQDLLGSLGFALRTFKNLNQFLELAPLIASRVTDADGSALILLKPNGQVKLERFYCNGDRADHIKQAFETATRQLSQNNAQIPGKISLPNFGNRSNSLDQQIALALGNGIQAHGAEIAVRNAERGRLYVFSSDRTYSWSETRKKLLQLVADQTAVAIENGELTVELRKKERLDRELEIGAEIQVQLLPRQCPNIEGIELAAQCRTANRVGGDYYDFIPAKYDQLRQKKSSKPESGRWSLAIGDVMGKGVPAGLIMTMLRGMLRAEVLNAHTPAQILQHLNHVMYADLENSNRFVTLFYSEYDCDNHLLSYSNAAHHPPLLWQSESDTIKRLDTLGMLIGLDMDSDYHEAQVQLAPGDVVIYYTDGFTDAANHNGDRFDEENLERHFHHACRTYRNPQGILDYLFAQVQQFIGSDRHNDDDMTLIVLRVKDEINIEVTDIQETSSPEISRQETQFDQETSFDIVEKPVDIQPGGDRPVPMLPELPSL